MGKQITLIAGNDDSEVKVDSEILKLSITLSNLLEDISASNVDILPVDNVNGDTLKKIIEYCEHHYKDPIPDEKEKTPPTTVIDPWDQEFMKDITKKMLFELLTAANYLDIKGLLDLGCQTIADDIRGKTTEQIQKDYAIPSDQKQ